MANYMHRTTDSSEPGAFMAGFTMGLFAGAAGYFLFATPKGDELRRKVLAEWEQARDHLVAEGVLSPQTVSLRQLVRDLMEKAVAPMLTDVRAPETKLRGNRDRAMRKDTVRRFRGV